MNCNNIDSRIGELKKMADDVPVLKEFRDGLDPDLVGEDSDQVATVARDDLSTSICPLLFYFCLKNNNMKNSCFSFSLKCDTIGRCQHI